MGPDFCLNWKDVSPTLTFEEKNRSAKCSENINSVRPLGKSKGPKAPLSVLCVCLDVLSALHVSNLHINTLCQALQCVCSYNK